MNILLTDTTGFVDGVVAVDLADKGLLDDTHLVVRDSTPADGFVRLRDNLYRSQLPKTVLDGVNGAQIVPFDLRNVAATAPDDPKAIVNCAALATFSNHPSL